MSTYVFINLLNEFGEINKVQGLPSILSFLFFATSSYKFKAVER